MAVAITHLGRHQESAQALVIFKRGFIFSCNEHIFDMLWCAP